MIDLTSEKNKLVDETKQDEWKEVAGEKITQLLQDGGAVRLNEGKRPMHLVPVSTINAIADVLNYGMKNYEERNWERGFNFSIPYACAMRHLTKWWAGEDLDDESGLSHLYHVQCNIAMLIEFLETYPEGDDRNRKLRKVKE